MNLPCTVCQAPVPVWDFKAHLKACMKIQFGTPRPIPTGLTAQETAFNDQAQAHLRESTPGDTHLPSPKQVDDARDKFARWASMRNEAPAATPEGRVRCAHCNGLTHMYPNCSNCDGTGWV